MKKLTIALLGSLAFFSPVLGLRGVAAAQRVVTRIAYDQCQIDPINWELLCYIGMAVDGYDGLVADGIGPKWSPDGSKIAFTGTKYPNGGEILVLNLADGSITNLTNHPASDSEPVWSPDGGKIAFVSDRDGVREIYVMEANGANPTRVTHNVGFPGFIGITGEFSWSPDGRRFAFISYGDSGVWPELDVVDVDGSNLIRLTNNLTPYRLTPYRDRPFVWSRDGSRIAFDCPVDGATDICAVNSDGTNFVRLASDPAYDYSAVFSPIDDRIAFVTERFGTGPEIAVMDADGTIRRIAPGTGGTQPVWSPDGNRLIFISTIPTFYTGACDDDSGFCTVVFGMYVVNADGTGLTALASGANPDWFASLPGQPVAAFTYQCTGVTCDFDAGGSFDSDGTIASYLWRFGDGTSDSGPAVHHAYATGDQYGVSLTVTDNTGATGVVRVPVRANGAPVASFTVACSGPTCTFDGSGSSDPDGTIASYSWSFGDGQSGAGATVNHTYATGTFSARLTVTDNGGATGTALGTVSVVNAAPVAAFTSTCNGLTCTFDGSSSSDPDGTITQYHWSFADESRTVAEALGVTANYTFAAGGTYTVTLIVTDNSGTTGTALATLSVVGATFTSTCNGLTCTFDGSGSSAPGGTITQYQWSFGDGSTALGATASHTFAAGTYTVTLIVTGNGGTTTHSQTVSVVALNVPPVASFTFACSGLTCTFDASGSSDSDGTIAGYEWCSTMPNGGWCFSAGVSGATATWTYAAGGTYTVTLAVMDNGGAVSRTSHVVTVNAPPVASFTSTCSGLTCNFNASGSSDPDGTIASYAWTFGDGTTGSGAMTSRTYAAGGSYTVTLTVTDNAAATHQRASTVIVNAPPVASFTSACSALTCSFNASGSSDPDGTIVSYAWTFGDGTTGAGATTSRAYAAGGSYTVTLTVTDNAAATNQTTSTVIANAPPVASFTSACSGLTCSFNASGSSDPDGTIASYVWTFGDGTTGAGAMASRTYAAGGSYTVTLTVTDNAAATSQTVHVVAVNAPPVAAFTSACSGLTCTFNASWSSDPDGTIASYAWTFGDGTTGAGATTSRTYAAGGSYTVTLTVTDNGAATSMQAQSVTVVPPDMHVGDLDGASTAQQSAWTAIVTITIHTSSHGLLANATVSGTWNDGSTGSCMTMAAGQCAISKAGIPKKTGSVTFTVANVGLGTFVYKLADNHDPDGDSNGMTIGVIKP